MSFLIRQIEFHWLSVTHLGLTFHCIVIGNQWLFTDSDLESSVVLLLRIHGVYACVRLDMNVRVCVRVCVCTWVFKLEAVASEYPSQVWRSPHAEITILERLLLPV